MRLQQLDHFGIEVRDLKRAEKFYTEVMGLTVAARLGDQILLDCNGQNLALFHVNRAEMSPAQRAVLIANPLGKGHHAFRVAREDFLSASEQFRKAGVENAKAIDWGDHDCMYFLDPDGNLMEIVSYR
jgi:catechol 2,3-dioxygenase-like lactoylglutathione lyase family enzyme